jgi:hypothetical protein
MEHVGTYAHRCGLCDRRPRWSLMRHGDARVTWACPDHLVLVLTDLLPTGEHRNQVTVTDLENAWQPTR